MINGLPPSEISLLTIWEYNALLWQWNDRHDDRSVKPPSNEDYYRMKAELEADGYKLLH